MDALAEQVRASPALTMTGLTYLRAANADDVHLESAQTVRWSVVEDNVGMGIGDGEIPASEFQAANPIYILLFGLPLSLLWAFLATRRRDPSTPVKFGLGVVQLGLGFGVFWWGTQVADARGMSSMAFLLFGWLLITTGELFSSPIGLSMVTKLSPSRLVSTIMGGWFLATAFSNYLAAVIATFTVASDESLATRLGQAIIHILFGEEHASTDLQFIGPPSSTVSTYGEVFGLIALIAIGAGLFLLVISPFLRRGMHLEELEKEDEEAASADTDVTEGSGAAAHLSP
jgi:POT family proton-dependent oligopeptide transporter